jgi:integrase/recombinase XerD
MTRTRAAKKNRDGISIEDLWAMRGGRTGARWRYRIWDASQRKYKSAVFHDDLEADEGRRVPGCAGGDNWAKTVRARLDLGQDTAAVADLPTLASAYVQKLNDTDPPLNEYHVAEVKRVLDGLIDSGATDLTRPAAFRAKVEHYMHELSAQTTGKEGVVRRVKFLKLQPSTKRRYLGHIQAVIQFALERGCIVRNPLLGMNIRSTSHKSMKPVFTLADMHRLAVTNSPEDPAWIWVMIMLYSGLRRNEALALKWADIDWNAHLLIVRNGKGSKARVVPIQDELFQILAPLGGPDAKNQRVGLVISCPTLQGADTKKKWARFRRVLRQHGIRADQETDVIRNLPTRLSPHSCRHTYCALMLATGIDSMLLKQYTGHASKDMTEHYSRQVAMYVRQVEADAWAKGQFKLTRIEKSSASA